MAVAGVLASLVPAQALADGGRGGGGGGGGRGGGGPVASFTFAPATPPAGQPVVLTSTSRPAGLIRSTLWDFDEDGVFDAIGTSVTTSFAAPGPHLVRLEVIDRKGDTGIAAQTVTVGPPLPPPPPPPAPIATPVLMNPFPLVRMQGRILASGVRVTRLTVSAPAGARVRGVCVGSHRGCPRRTVVRRSTSPRVPVRLRALERRLRPGAVIQVFVTDGRAIGKYVSFRVPRHGAPLRRDLCVAAGGTAPVRCPGA